MVGGWFDSAPRLSFNKGNKMTKEEYIKEICKREVKSEVESLEWLIQNIYDIIGDLQKGKISVEDIPSSYRDIIKDYPFDNG